MTSADRCSWLLAALVVIAGCFDPTYHAPSCGPGGQCPSGLHCEEARCVEPCLGHCPEETPRRLFDRTVKPLLIDCVSCHVGTEHSATNMFLGPDGLDSAYDALVKDRSVNGGFDPAAARLLLKGQHEGPPWTAAQSETIATWLRAELAVRGPLPPDSPTQEP